jgi:hypothetical protein
MANLKITIGYLLSELYTTQAYFVTEYICVVVVDYSSLGNPLYEFVRQSSVDSAGRLKFIERCTIGTIQLL